MVVKAGKLPSPGETVLGGEFLINPGGKGANQAVAAARLGSAVAMVGCVGSDVFGDEAIAGLKDELVDCSHIYRDDNRASGVALISVDEKGENHIVVAPGANSALSLQHVEQSFNHIPDNALVMLQLEIPLNTVSHVLTLARQKNCKIILDPAPARELPDTVFQDLFLITPNQSEAAMLTGIDIEDINAAKTAAQQLLEMGVKNVALTLGGQGVIFASEQGIEVIAAPTVSALDSTAAGDCFNGALANALVKGATLSEAIKFACHAASIAVTRLGAQNAMPREQELNSFV
jgi:ribokinase